mgnify:CR=1 FL=1
MATRVQPEILTPGDHAQVITLFQHARLRHIHLDWRTFPIWLSEPTLVCRVLREPRGKVIALLGATLVPRGEAWLRFVLPADRQARQSLQGDLITLGVQQVSVLCFTPWIVVLLTEWGFKHTNAVVTLRYTEGVIPQPPRAPWNIRQAVDNDLLSVAALDATAFPPLWQHSEATLQHARKQAATFTVLECEDILFGYQLSTQHANVGHLARLAVLPQAQGQGLGGLLVGEMIRSFQSRSTHVITVNTQEDNIRSQRLYRRLGFRDTGHSVAVWSVSL